MKGRVTPEEIEQIRLGIKDVLRDVSEDDSYGLERRAMAAMAARLLSLIDEWAGRAAALAEQWGDTDDGGTWLIESRLEGFIDNIAAFAPERTEGE